MFSGNSIPNPILCAPAQSLRPVQVMSFDDNPLGFSEDAALINSPVTMLKIGGAGNSGNDTETAEGKSRRDILSNHVIWMMSLMGPIPKVVPYLHYICSSGYIFWLLSFLLEQYLRKTASFLHVWF